MSWNVEERGGVEGRDKGKALVKRGCRGNRSVAMYHKKNSINRQGGIQIKEEW
jgi:hypothetical protein